MSFIYKLSAHFPDWDLARAELWAMTGVQTEGLEAEADIACDITRAAFISWCGEVLVKGKSLQGLCSEIWRLRLAMDRFRVDVRKTEPKVAEGTRYIAGEIAATLRGRPDLDNPVDQLRVVCNKNDWTLMRVLSSSDHGYVKQEGRPRNFSFALRAAIARTMVNLVAVPGDTLIDPCCGVGTALIEALHMGIRAEGCEISKPTVYMARANLTHFDLPNVVTLCDGREVEGLWDAAILDPPYGHSTVVDVNLRRELLVHLAPRVYRIALVTGEPIEAELAELGLEVLKLAIVKKGSLVRHIYMLRGLRT